MTESKDTYNIASGVTIIWEMIDVDLEVEEDSRGNLEWNESENDRNLVAKGEGRWYKGWILVRYSDVTWIEQVEN